MNELNKMDIADLSQDEVDKLIRYEQEMNKLHNGEEIYLLALKK